jgi:hypothetical protein
MCISVGYSPGPSPLVDEFNGSTWSSVTLPVLPPSTIAALPTVVSCTGSFCMLGPVAQSSTGALWMATLSGGTWSDTEINSVTPESSSNYQVGALSCPSSGVCMIAIEPPGSSLSGFVPYGDGTWGAEEAVATESSAGDQNPTGIFSLSCTSIAACIAAVEYPTAGGLQSLDGTTWSVVGSVPGSSWNSVSCPTIASCLAVSQQGFEYETPPLDTQVSATVYQSGPEDITVAATVSWPQLSETGPVPLSVTYYLYGQPIDGCTNIALPTTALSPVHDPGCDVFFFGGGSYSFTASVNPDIYYNGSVSSSVNGTVQNGYWEVGTNGSVYQFGSAVPYGDASQEHLSKPIVGMALTGDDYGYWLVASDGGIFSFGDAEFYGSTGAVHLNKPIVGMAATPDGGGYWLVASDGGIFSFGDAEFYGSTGGSSIPGPIAALQSS